ncbi:hypothetical protein F5882DRAFT_413575 [Hyaloscypha sp. PMI_1271]|nr:hypothetical protein F5882DRAFT_413575 [Hyaloscypha sp. PMI_1271]
MRRIILLLMNALSTAWDIGLLLLGPLRSLCFSHVPSFFGGQALSFIQCLSYTLSSPSSFVHLDCQHLAAAPHSFCIPRNQVYTDHV